MTPSSFLKGTLTALLFGQIISITILCLVPPVSRDALIHHLKVPQLYLDQGGIYEIPDMVFSYNPMNLDLLYMIPLYFGNDIAPKLIHFSFALATAFLIYAYLHGKCGREYGILGALLFLSVPIVVKLSITVYVDLGLIFFATASLLMFVKWIENTFRPKYLIMSGVLCGLALGTKYNGLIPLFILTMMAPLVYSRFHPTRPGFFLSASQGLLFLCVALLLYAPWGIRNYLWKGNPIYPLYHGLFTEKSDRKTPSGPGRPSPLAHRRLIYGESNRDILLLPVRVFFEGEDANPQSFDGKMNPYLLILPFFAFLNLGHEKKERSNQIQKWVFLAFAVFTFLFSVFGTILRIRYISPIIPPLTILSIFGIRNVVEWIHQFSRKYQRQLAWIGLAVALIYFFGANVRYVYGQFQFVRPLSFLSGEESRDAYITHFRPEYPVMQYINTQLPEDILVLFVFIGKRGYYCHKPYVLDMKGLTSTITAITMDSETPEEILEKLKKIGITHLLVRFDSLENWISEQMPSEKTKLFKTFISHHTTLLYSHKWYGVAALSEVVHD